MGGPVHGLVVVGGKGFSAQKRGRTQFARIADHDGTRAADAEKLSPCPFGRVQTLVFAVLQFVVYVNRGDGIADGRVQPPRKQQARYRNRFNDGGRANRRTVR